MAEIQDKNFPAHDALEDSKALQSTVFQCCSFKQPELLLLSISTAWSNQQEGEIARLEEQFLPSLLPMVASKAVSAETGRKIARSGLGYKHLQLAHTRNGFQGIKNVCVEICNGQVRISNSAIVIRKLGGHFDCCQVKNVHCFIVFWLSRVY